MSEEDAFWKAIGAAPHDQLPRVAFADWLDEHGREDEGAALRATADRVPFTPVPAGGERHWSWICDPRQGVLDSMTAPILDALGGKRVDGYTNWRDYSTAEDAIRDLCRAWVKVHRTPPNPKADFALRHEPL